MYSVLHLNFYSLAGTAVENIGKARKLYLEKTTSKNIKDLTKEKEEKVENPEKYQKDLEKDCARKAAKKAEASNNQENLNPASDDSPAYTTRQG